MSTQGGPGGHALQSLHPCSQPQLSRDPGLLDSPGGWVLWTLSLRQRWGVGAALGALPGKRLAGAQGRPRSGRDQALPAPHRAVWEAGHPQSKAWARARLLSSAGSGPVCREPPTSPGAHRCREPRRHGPAPRRVPVPAPHGPHHPPLSSESPHPTPPGPGPAAAGTQQPGSPKRGVQGRARGSKPSPTVIRVLGQQSPCLCPLEWSGLPSPSPASSPR